MYDLTWVMSDFVMSDFQMIFMGDTAMTKNLQWQKLDTK